MHATNGHGSRRVVLYTRVSTDEQARTGYSLAQQIEALRAYVVREGYEILEEVADPGQSGASLERPGMDRVRDLIANGGVSVVLAQDRDRFAREPAYLYLLRKEFEERGTQLRALNDRGDESPEGELTDGILDQLAKFERAKTAERTRRGKLRKAREGRVIIGRSPRYGFKPNALRDGYEIDEQKIRVVRRIFGMVAEGVAFRSIKLTFEQEGIPTPKGAKHWDRAFFRSCVLDDVYRPHTFEEVAAVVSPEVAAHLDPEKLYGVWWFNRRRMTSRQVSEVSEDGRRYGKKYSSYIKPKEEWIAVPVPNSGIPRELADSAREAVRNNGLPSTAGRRFWELSGGVACCGACGRRMRTVYRTKHRKNGLVRSYGYYKCSGYSEHGEKGCPNRRMVSARTLEEKAWRFVRGVLTDPEELTKDIDRMIELKRKGQRGDPRRETEAWLEELAKLERMRDGYHDQAAEGLMGLDKLKEKLVALEEKRVNAEQELRALEGYKEELEQLERDRNTVIGYYTALAPETIDSLGPEDRHRLYGILKLKVLVGKDGEVWAEIPMRPPASLSENPSVYHAGVTPRSALTAARSSSVLRSRSCSASSVESKG